MPTTSYLPHTEVTSLLLSLVPQVGSGHMGGLSRATVTWTAQTCRLSSKIQKLNVFLQATLLPSVQNKFVPIFTMHHVYVHICTHIYTHMDIWELVFNSGDVLAQAKTFNLLSYYFIRKYLSCLCPFASKIIYHSLKKIQNFPRIITCSFWTQWICQIADTNAHFSDMVMQSQYFKQPRKHQLPS